MKLRVTTNTLCLFLLLIFVGLGFLFTRADKDELVKRKSETKLVKRNISEVRLDTFRTYLQQVYQGNISFRTDNGKMNIKIVQQGKMVSDFINANERLLEPNDFCSVTMNTAAGSLEAEMETKTIDDITYVLVPNDVLIGVAAK